MTLQPFYPATAAGGSPYLYEPSGQSSGVKDTATINSIIQNGQQVQLVGGIYYINSTLQPDTYGGIMGIGQGTRLQAVGSISGDMINLLHPATTAFVNLGSFMLIPNVGALNGIRFDNTGFTPVGSYVIYDPLHTLDNIFVKGAGGDAYHFDNNARGISIQRCQQYFAGGYGFYGGPGASAGGAGMTDCRFTACTSGPSGNHGFMLAAGSSDNTFTGSKAFYSGYNEATAAWGTTQCGFEVQGDWNVFAACNAQQAALHGFDLNNCSYVAVGVNDADTNNAGNPGTGAGVAVNLNTAQYCAISGNVGSNNSSDPPGNQLYGVQVAGNCTGTTINGNPVSGAVDYYNYVSGYGSQLIGYNNVGLNSAVLFQSPSVTYSEDGTVQALSTASTIANSVSTTGSNFGIYPVSSTVAVTGLILQAPDNGGGTTVTIVNTTGFALTFAAKATSNVADGVLDVIPAYAARTFIYDSVTSLWYRAA
jgi:hypothetical protein